VWDEASSVLLRAIAADFFINCLFGYLFMNIGKCFQFFCTLCQAIGIAQGEL
jgi:hypothetical protein